MSTFIDTNNIEAQEKSRERLMKAVYMEELERARRLSDLDQLRMSKALAMSTSQLIKTSNYPTLNSNYQGTRRHLKRAEEAERTRRGADLDEARARKANAMKVADAVNTDAGTIKARFVRRPPSKGFFAEAADKALQMLPQHPLHMPSFSDVVDAATSIKDNIVQKLQDIAHIPTLAHAKALEEEERARRIAEDPSGTAAANGRKVAGLIKGVSFPPSLGRSRGINNYLRRVEERERNRRLANKHEGDFNRNGASKLANMIDQLGWPFIHSAKNSKPILPAAELEEGERRRRMSDPQFTPRYNANKVSNLIKEATLPHDPRSSHQYTRGLEEAERKNRGKNDHLHALPNARKIAQLISGAEHPANVQSLPLSATQPQKPADDWEHLNRLEEEERVRRMLNGDRLQARKNARKVAKLINNNQALPDNVILNKNRLRREPLERNLPDTRSMEESERRARMGDKFQQLQAMDNAGRLSRVIKQVNPYNQRNNQQYDAEAPPLSPAHSLELSPAVLVGGMEPAAMAAKTLPVAPLQHQPLQLQQQQQSLQKSLPQNLLRKKATRVDSPIPPHAKLLNSLQTPSTPTPSLVPDTYSPISSDFATVTPFPNSYIPSTPATPFTSPYVEAAGLPQEFSNSPAPLPNTALPTANIPTTTLPTTTLPATTSLPNTFAPIPTTTSSLPRSLAPLPSQILRPNSGTPTLPRPVSATASPVTPVMTVPSPLSTTPIPVVYRATDAKLIDSVQRLYELETAAAEKEREKATRISDKHSRNGRLGNFLVHRHEHKANKHIANAERHQQFLANLGATAGKPAF